MKPINIAILGASGLVGQTLLTLLSEEAFNIPINNLHLFSSGKNKNTYFFNNTIIPIIETNSRNLFKNPLDYAFLCIDDAFSATYAPLLSKSGVIVIDNSAYFRLDKDTPLIVPEINPDCAFRHKNIIANPNCSTIQIALALFPLHKAFKLKEIVVSTYQAVSGGGYGALHDYKFPNEVRQALPYPIISNTIPVIGDINSDGNTKEELKIKNELSKILDIPALKVYATAVRVPVENCHCASIHAVFDNDFTLPHALSLLNQQESLNLYKNALPMPITQSNKNDVAVGRVRKLSPNTIDMWVVADNLRKGAAANALQIAQLFIKNNIYRSKQNYE